MTYKTLFSTILIAFFAFAVSACGGDQKPADADLSGSWSGTSEDVTLNLTLNEDQEDNLSGSGSISGPENSYSVTVTSGTHSGDSFSTALDPGDQFENITYSGTIRISQGAGGTGPENQVRLNGSMVGSGFDNFSISLTR